MKGYLIENLESAFDSNFYGEGFNINLFSDHTLEKIKVLDDLIKAINEKLDVTSLDNIEELYYNSLNNRLDSEFLKSYNNNEFYIADLLAIIDRLLSRSNEYLKDNEGYYYQFNIDQFNKNLLIIEDLREFLNMIDF